MTAVSSVASLQFPSVSWHQINFILLVLQIIIHSLDPEALTHFLILICKMGIYWYLPDSCYKVNSAHTCTIHCHVQCCPYALAIIVYTCWGLKYHIPGWQYQTSSNLHVTYGYTNWNKRKNNTSYSTCHQGKSSNIGKTVTFSKPHNLKKNENENNNKYQEL